MPQFDELIELYIRIDEMVLYLLYFDVLICMCTHILLVLIFK